ncbi:MAG TPA: hypothetical protein VFQ95_02700 [Rhodanobacteraceae bacterium]|nr:hypothetical protein [Rhodanobacteraceae bacterium]
MNRFLTLAGAVLATGTLAACSPGVNEGIGHRITFDSNGIVVHAMGHPNAHVSRNGDLSVGGKAIAVTPAQRRLLQGYYQQAGNTMDTGEAMAKRGIGNAIGAIFHHGSPGSSARANTASQDMEKTATVLCADVATLGATQNEIAAAIPAFAPYASGDTQCKITRGHGAKSSSFRFTMNGGSAKSTTSATTPATSSHP